MEKYIVVSTVLEDGIRKVSHFDFNSYFPEFNMNAGVKLLTVKALGLNERIVALPIRLSTFYVLLTDLFALSVAWIRASCDESACYKDDEYAGVHLVPPNDLGNWMAMKRSVIACPVDPLVIH
jgi:hypothetical protein